MDFAGVSIPCSITHSFRIIFCQELNYSRATPDSFPVLLRPTFPHYSGVHSCTTPVYIPALLRSILLCYSSPPLDWTRLHLTCLSTRLAPDLTWEVAVIHLSLMYPFLVIYTYQFRACFQPIYTFTSPFPPQSFLPHTGSG